MFSIVGHAFQWLQTQNRYPKRQAALTQKIVDRIRNSLELSVVLQTAVDEIATLLRLESCNFFWYFEDTQRVMVVCEQNFDNREARIGYHSLESFGSVAEAIATGKLLVDPGSPTPTRNGVEHGDQGKQVLGYRASLLVPVMGEAERIGFIACLAEQPRTWSGAEIQFLEAIAKPLEVAIRQAQLYEQTQKLALRERLVNQIATQTRQSFDPRTILTEAIAQLLDAMQVDRCLVHLVELNNPGVKTLDRGTAVRRQHLYEVYHPLFSASLDDFDIDGPITQWVIQHRRLVTIPDITQDHRIGKANEEYQKAEIKSSLVVPVQANGILHALLYLNQCSYIRYWSRNDQNLAEAVADQLAISLQQAHLYAQTQEQAANSSRQAEQLAQTLEELRLAQSQLIQSEKMLSLGRIVAGVAHEINNPIGFISGNIPFVDGYINSLIGLVQAYRTHYPHPEAQIQRQLEEVEVDFLIQDLPKILQSMRSGAQRIQEIVELLQKFSGNNVASRQRIDLNAALESTLLILQNQLTDAIAVERVYDTIPLVECYPKPIKQAFLSILTNAVEALNRSSNFNKTLRLSTKWLPEHETSGDGRVQIVIQDNGPGIEREIQPKIFEPFFTTKDIGQGRGLGLTLSYQTIVNLHKGQLDVSSGRDRGTQFLIEIPLRQPLPFPQERVTDPSLSVPQQIPCSTDKQ